MPYRGIATFLKAPTTFNNDTKMVVSGVTYDLGTSYRPGARLGPRAIRNASMMLTDGVHPNYPVNVSKHLVDLGDVGVVSSDYPIIHLGGDHSITNNILRTLPPDLVLLHFDAHQDTSIPGENVNGHGCWLREAIETGRVKGRNVLSLGIRAPIQESCRGWFEEQGGKKWSARDVLRNQNDAIDAVIAHIKGKPLYITFDVDCLDPAYAPGTGTPEVGGLTPHFVFDLFEAIQPEIRSNLVGMDIVEVNPAYDHAEITALAAATVAWTVASIYLSS